MSTTMLHVRVDDGVKERAALALGHMGLTISEAIRLFLHRVAADQALPFEIKVPNARTRAAIEESRLLSVCLASSDELANSVLRK